MKGLSLRTKVFLLFAGAALLTLLPALVLVSQTVQERVYERATGELESASTALGRTWVLRDSLLLQDAKIRARTPALARAWQARELPEMRRVLTDGLDSGQVVLAIDTSGTVLLGPPVEAELLRQLDSWSVPGTQEARENPEATVVLLNDQGRPIRFAVWPVLSDSGPPEGITADSAETDSAAMNRGGVIGIAGVGTPLGASTLADLKNDLAGATDLAIAVGDSLVASTLPDTLAAEVAQQDLRAAIRGGRPSRVDLAGHPYLAAVYPLRARGAPTFVLLFRPIADELKVAKGILGSLIAIGVASLLIALLLAGIVARIVARPTQVLAEATAHLARGDFQAPLPPASGDEIGQLTRAFREMRSAIAEREQRLRSAQAEMIHREKLAAMGRLVAQLSHEINNPIYNIQNCLEALERRGDPADPNREFLELAQEELTRMATLTRRLLDQSRPLPDAATPLDLNQVVQRVVSLAGPELAAGRIALQLQLAPDLPRVTAHPDAIQQVLANLFANARDAMPGGGVLEVATRADADVVEVSVRDSGTGIPPEHLPHVFEAFYTTKPGIRGIGLGLFVSEGIVRGHRGRLLVESEPGEGSRFIIRLPRETLDPAFLNEDPAPEVRRTVLSAAR